MKEIIIVQSIPAAATTSGATERREAEIRKGPP